MRRLVIVLLLALGLVTAQSPALASTTETHGGINVFFTGLTSLGGQTFTVPAAPAADTFFSRLTVDRFITKNNASFTVAVSAVDGAGLPTGAPLWTSPTLPNSADGSVVVYPNITLTPGTTYAFFMSNATFATTQGSSNNAYSGGATVGLDFTTGNWSATSSIDLGFKAEFNTGEAYTGTALVCTPAAVLPGQPTTCTATVTNLGTGPASPSGSVSFSKNQGSGNFSAASCLLVNGTCSVTYTPSAVASPTITGTYAGDSTHLASTGTTPVAVKVAQAINTSQLPLAGFVGLSLPFNVYGGGSGNPVVLSVDPATTNGACTVSGSTATYVRAGVCVIAFNQAGTATYFPAPQVTRTLQVYGFGF